MMLELGALPLVTFSTLTRIIPRWSPFQISTHHDSFRVEARRGRWRVVMLGVRDVIVEFSAVWP
eukprot:4567883-Pleurochrysis_carterae.AAC.1